MVKVNITPATKRIAEAGGLYIERDTQTLPAYDGGEQSVDSVVIGEENSDFLIIYLVSTRGLVAHVHPHYINDMPSEITTSLQLRSLVTKLVQEFIKAS